MILSPDTIKILENFSKINPAIILNPGKQITTFSQLGSVLATAEIEEYIEYELPIVDVKSFLQAISLFEQPEIDVKSDEYMTIAEQSGGASCNFYFGSKELIKKPPVNQIDLASVLFEFDLSAKTLANVLKAASVFRLEKATIYNDGTNIMLGVTNPDKPSQNTFDVVVAEGWEGDDFRLYIRTDSLSLLPGDYKGKVEMDEYNLIELARTDDKVTYWVAVDG